MTRTMATGSSHRATSGGADWDFNSGDGTLTETSVYAARMLVGTEFMRVVTSIRYKSAHDPGRPRRRHERGVLDGGLPLEVLRRVYPRRGHVGPVQPAGLPLPRRGDHARRVAAGRVRRQRDARTCAHGFRQRRGRVAHAERGDGGRACHRVVRAGYGGRGCGASGCGLQRGGGGGRRRWGRRRWRGRERGVHLRGARLARGPGRIHRALPVGIRRARAQKRGDARALRRR